MNDMVIEMTIVFLGVMLVTYCGGVGLSLLIDYFERRK